MRSAILLAVVVAAFSGCAINRLVGGNYYGDQTYGGNAMKSDTPSAKNLGLAYLIAVPAFVLPTLAGFAVAHEAHGLREWAAGTLYCLGSCWGTSFAAYYLGSWKYATFAGVGRTSLLLATLLLAKYSSIGDEASLPFLAAQLWSLVDLVILPFLRIDSSPQDGSSATRGESMFTLTFTY